MDKKYLMVGWKVATLEPNVASVRYRVLLPILALEQHDIQSRLFSDGKLENLKGLDVLVIAKSFTPEDICLAQEAKSLGIPVVYDLCDNVFIASYRKIAGYAVDVIFRSIADNVVLITATTESLAEVIRRHLNSSVPVHVVPDGIDTEPLIEAGLRRLSAVCNSASKHHGKFSSKLMRELSLLRTYTPFGIMRRLVWHGRKYLYWRYWANKAYVRFDALRNRWYARQLNAQFIAVNETVSENYPMSVNLSGDLTDSTSSNEKVHQILWFGNHGGTHARFGMLDLLEISEALESIASEYNVELVVLSNNLDKYNQHILPLAIPSRYVQWTREAMKPHLREADVVVVPNTLDDFSICKSSNRTVLSLFHGVPVVATYTSALAPLSECIELDDFERGLKRYFSNPEHVRDHVERGRKLVTELYGQDAIGNYWRDILKLAINTPSKISDKSAMLIVVLNLPQDLDLAIPILQAAQNRGLLVEVWCSLTLLNESLRVKAALDDLDILWRVLQDKIGKNKAVSSSQVVRLLGKSKGLLVMSESNLPPHKFTHQIIKIAKKRGVVTSVVQHGYENIGLSYSDKSQSISKINFAAERVYIWGPLYTLHPNIPSGTRIKCFPVGSTKPANAEPVAIPSLQSCKTVVGIFENLHWDRYSNDYCKFFLDGIQQLADSFPHITFLVKPHHAGLWITHRYDGTIPSASNLVIADPTDPVWEPYTATQLLGCMNAVITSPSTVALDAARAGIPVAVVTHNMDIECYKPLYNIKNSEQWLALIESINDPQQRAGLVQLGEKFVREVVIPGDASEIILDDIYARIKVRKKNMLRQRQSQ